MCVCATDQCSGVGFGALVQQDFGHAVVPAVCRHVERREVVQSDVVDLCVVLKELLDAVHVVALRRHVDRRQAVLKEQDEEEALDRQVHMTTLITMICYSDPPLSLPFAVFYVNMAFFPISDLLLCLSHALIGPEASAYKRHT